jgi:hypothetical protein
MPLKAEGINPMAAALEALSVQSQIQARDKERRNLHAYTTVSSLLDYTLSRATLDVIPPPVDFSGNVTPIAEQANSTPFSGNNNAIGGN